MTEIKLSEFDKEWVEQNLERKIRETPAPLIEVYDAEHPEGYEAFWRKRLTAERLEDLRKAEAKRLAQEQRQEALLKVIEAEIVELYGINYFFYHNGKRLPKVKHLSDAVRCECGQPVDVSGAVRELYDKRHAMLIPGAYRDELPFKVQISPNCPKCKASLGYISCVVIA